MTGPKGTRIAVTAACGGGHTQCGDSPHKQRWALASEAQNPAPTSTSISERGAHAIAGRLCRANGDGHEKHKGASVRNGGHWEARSPPQQVSCQNDIDSTDHSGAPLFTAVHCSQVPRDCHGNVPQRTSAAQCQNGWPCSPCQWTRNNKEEPLTEIVLLVIPSHTKQFKQRRTFSLSMCRQASESHATAHE